MSRTVYVNGEYVEEEKATVSIFDRAYLFADAVYEVTAVLGGKLIDFDRHMTRLGRSLAELEMRMMADRDELLTIHRELIQRNALDQGCIYLQISRGCADRDFVFPGNTPQSLVLFTQVKDLSSAKKGVSVISVPDIRWGRRDIKTVQLLPASMAKMMARRAGKDDAWMVGEDGLVTEGTSNNAYIVTHDDKIVTRNLTNSILHGITRASVLRMAAEQELEIEERPFTIAEAQQAKEAFSTSATTFVLPVVEIDGVQLGDGKPGVLTRRLSEVYLEESLKSAV